MDWDVDSVPNPQDTSTFTNSKLDWSEVTTGDHAALLDFHRELITVRRTYADLTDPRFDRALTSSDDEEGWLMVERGDMVLIVNFSDSDAQVGLPFAVESVIEVGTVAVTDDSATLGAHSAYVGQQTQPA